MRGPPRLSPATKATALLGQLRKLLVQALMVPGNADRTLLAALNAAEARLSNKRFCVAVVGLGGATRSQRLTVARVLVTDVVNESNLAVKLGSLFERLVVEDLDVVVRSSSSAAFHWDHDESKARVEIYVPCPWLDRQGIELYIPRDRQGEARPNLLDQTGPADHVLVVLSGDELASSGRARSRLRDELLRIGKRHLQLCSRYAVQAELAYLASDEADSAGFTRYQHLSTSSGLACLKTLLEKAVGSGMGVSKAEQKLRSSIVTARLVAAHTLASLLESGNLAVDSKDQIPIVARALVNKIEEFRQLTESRFCNGELAPIFSDMGRTKTRVTEWFHRGWIWQSLLTRVNEVADELDRVLFDQLLADTEFSIVHATGKLNQQLTSFLSGLQGDVRRIKRILVKDRLSGTTPHVREQLSQLEALDNKITLALATPNIVQPFALSFLVRQERGSIFDSKEADGTTGWMRRTLTGFWTLQISSAGLMLLGPTLYSLPLLVAVPSGLGISALGLLWVKHRWNSLHGRLCHFLDDRASHLAQKLANEHAKIVSQVLAKDIVAKLEAMSRLK
ncbi:hypothetical protein EV182_001212, partial [Spiromyces aspiralis]